MLQTSIVFTLQEGPGALFKALAVFAMRGINLSKVIVETILAAPFGYTLMFTDSFNLLLQIESRPQKMWPLWVVDDSNKQGAK